MTLSIALVGMPGGGKSTVGRQLARRIDAAFIDTDTAIERLIGCTVRQYFEQYGEASFRSIEADVLAESLGHGGRVIATGGGIVTIAANRALLRERATCLYLRSSPEELFRRLRHDTRRPLLQVADPLSKLRQLFVERDPLYREAAHFVIDTGRPSVPTLVNMILMQLELAGVIDSSDVPSPIDSPPV